MIGAEHVDQPPGDASGVGGFASPAQLRYNRLTRRRRAGNAGEIERDVVDQTKIRAPGTDRQMLGEVTVRAQCAHAQFGDRRLIVGAGKLAQREEHVGAGIVRRHAAALFLHGAPPRKSSHRV